MAIGPVEAAAAAETSESWPSWRKPMVGTKATAQMRPGRSTQVAPEQLRSCRRAGANDVGAAAQMTPGGAEEAPGAEQE
jgi:hypothetical protein